MQFFALAAIVGVALAAPVEEVVEKRGATHRGVATYFYQGGNAGSCGQKHRDSDVVVAISHRAPFTYNAHCGQQVTIKNVGGGDQNNGVGKTITATVVDDCPSCDANHLDLSVGAFKALTGGHLDPPGQFNIEWHLN